MKQWVEFWFVRRIILCTQTLSSQVLYESCKFHTMWYDNDILTTLSYNLRWHFLSGFEI